MTFVLFGVLLSLLLSAFFSGTESGFYFIKRERLHLLEAQGSASASRILSFLKHPGALLSTILVGNNMALQLGTDSMMRYIASTGWAHPVFTGEVLTTLILFMPFFIFGEVLPKATYRLYSEEILLKTVPLIQFFKILFFPISFLTGSAATGLKKMMKVPAEDEFNFDRKNLSSHIGQAYVGGVFSEEQLESIGQVMNAGDRPVERMMTSLSQAPMISLGVEQSSLSELYEREPYTAYPVYASKKTDVMGWIDMRQLAKMGFSDQNVLDCMQRPVTVKVGTPFHDAISLFFEKEVPIIFVESDQKSPLMDEFRADDESLKPENKNVKNKNVKNKHMEQKRGEQKIIGVIFWVDALLKLLR